MYVSVHGRLDVCVGIGDCKTVTATGFDKEMTWTGVFDFD